MSYGLPKRKRSLYKKQKGVCWYCGEHIDYADFSIEHVIPLSRGGTNTWGNLVGACQRCNSEKGNQMPKEYQDSQWNKLMSLLKRGG